MVEGGGEDQPGAPEEAALPDGVKVRADQVVQAAVQPAGAAEKEEVAEAAGVVRQAGKLFALFSTGNNQANRL